MMVHERGPLVRKRVDPQRSVVGLHDRIAVAS